VRGPRGLVERVTGIEPALSAWESTKVGSADHDRIVRPVSDAVPLFWRFVLEKYGVGR
jgi:hypothetical protein